VSRRRPSRSPLTALALGLFALALGLFALTGCPRFQPGDYVFLDELEGPLCAGVPCGWTRVAGPEEGARWGQSLPGEHGLHLSGDGVVVRIEPASELPFSMTDTQLALDLIARCDLGATLTVEIGATDTSGASLGLEPMPLNILTTWTERRPNALTLGGTGASLRSIDSITVAKSGTGVCEIDWIGIFRTF